MEIRGIIWLPNITDWLRQHGQTHWTYADLSNTPQEIISVIPHGVGVVASISRGRDYIGWRQSKTTGETLQEKAIGGQCARANMGMLAGECAALDNTETENSEELKKEWEERESYRMAKVYNFLEIWQGS